MISGELNARRSECYFQVPVRETVFPDPATDGLGRQLQCFGRRKCACSRIKATRLSSASIAVLHPVLRILIVPPRSEDSASLLDLLKLCLGARALPET
jgi:hypothetical protein